MGSQTWMAENLKYEPSGNSVCNENMLSNCEMYGRLYDWTTIMNINDTYTDTLWNNDISHQGICPKDWHLPNRIEWNTLINFVGGPQNAGTRLKTSHDWQNSPSIIKGEDNYGFSTLPAGFRRTDGTFGIVGYHTYLWSASNKSATGAYAYGMHYDSNSVSEGNYAKTGYYSVRCINNTLNEYVPSSSSSLARSSSSSALISSSSSLPRSSSSSSVLRSSSAATLMCGDKEYKPPQICIKSVIHEPCGDDFYNTETEMCVNNTVVPLSCDDDYDSSSQFKDERDCQIYSIIDIGGQTWMSENLKFKATGSKCYKDTESNCNTYGRLYNWTMANTACPDDWHLPSDEEWGALIEEVAPACSGTESYCSNAGNILKDKDRFAALLGGYGNANNSYNNLGSNGYWWSNTQSTADKAYNRSMSSTDNYVRRNENLKTWFYSIRCVKD